MKKKLKMKMIALVFVLSVLTCLNARAVEENSVAHAALTGDEGRTVQSQTNFYIWKITTSMARLVLMPTRTIKLIIDAFTDVIHSWSLTEVIDGVLGALTVPLSAVIHSPELIKMSIEDVDQRIIPELKRKLEYIEKILKEEPLSPLRHVVTFVLMLPPHAVIQITGGILEGLAEIGVPWTGFGGFMLGIYYDTIIAKIKHIVDPIRDFFLQCHFAQSTCDDIFRTFETIVVQPAIKVVNGVMTLVGILSKKVKQVVIPIVDKLSPSKLQGYCKLVLPEEACTNIFRYINRIDNFSKQEITKVSHVVVKVIEWIKKHIFPHVFPSHVNGAKVIKSDQK